MRSDFGAYLDWDRDKRQARYAEVMAQLASLHEENAMVRSQEKEARVKGFVTSEGNTIKEREREADYDSLPLTLEVFRLQGEMAALTAEREFIEYLLED